MNDEKILELLAELAGKRFWGSVKFVIQDGKIAHVEIFQTIKQRVTQDDVLVVVSG